MSRRQQVRLGLSAGRLVAHAFRRDGRIREAVAPISQQIGGYSSSSQWSLTEASPLQFYLLSLNSRRDDDTDKQGLHTDLASLKLQGVSAYGPLQSMYSHGQFEQRFRFSSMHGLERRMSTKAGWQTTAATPPLQSSGEAASKLVKEAEAAACDEAVEDLSEAKAKAKQSQAETSDSKPIMQRTQAVFLGIGPALRKIMSMSLADWGRAMSGLWKSFKEALQHYWVGTKLLWADIKIASRLLKKLLNGKTLTRRERKQLTRTAADVFRLVPFAVIIIVPFMEFLLPVLLKVFPNMLPSTFQDKMKEEEQMKKRLQVRLQYAKFLQETVTEMAREVKSTARGDMRQTAEDLATFMSKVRTGQPVHNDEITGFAKLFNDELTLDNISRPRLVRMCKYMGLQAIGTDAYLRYMLRAKLSMIKQDDRLIQREGVDTLTESELRSACRQRGMLLTGHMTAEEMRKELREWLDLSLNRSLPSSLLILSRAFKISPAQTAADAVGATLSSLPDDVVDDVSMTTLSEEDTLAQRRRKLEYLKKQDERIKEEEEKARKEEEKRKKEEEENLSKDRALEEMQTSTSEDLSLDQKREELARAAFAKAQDLELGRISEALAVLASASSVSKERADFLALVNKEIHLYNQMVEAKGTDNEERAKEAYKAARLDLDQASAKGKAAGVSQRLVEKVDRMLEELEKELDAVDAKIGDRWRVLDRDHDGKVTPEEVAAAAAFLKDSLAQESVHDMIANLVKDKDGRILVEDIVKLGSLQGKESDAVKAAP